MTDERLTLRQAAARLGVSESAIRKRVERGTLRSDKGPDGRRYVYLDTGADTMTDKGADASATGERDTLISEMVEEMRAEVHYLRDQLHQELQRRSAEAERYQQIVAALTTANASLSERLRALEPPQEPPSQPRESPETVEEEPEGAEPRSSTGGSEIATEGLSEAEPSLLWERVAVVILSALPTLVFFILTLTTDILVSWAAIVAAGSAVLGWIVFPAVFGFRLGRKLRRLRFWRNVAPVAALLWLVVFIAEVLLIATFFFAVIPSIVYIFAAYWGNALRRRQREELIEERPSEFPQEAAASAQGWTPRQQAIVGLAGTIISALIGLIGTILTVLDRT